MDSIRTFIAVELDAPIQRELEHVQNNLRRELRSGAVRWVNPGSIHLTLKFLGDVPAAQLPEIKVALQKGCAAFSPFDLVVTGLGCFPGFSRPNVVWVGVQGDLATLRRLRDSVEQHVAPLGYPTEQRDFTAHLTLGRVKNASPAEARRIGDAVRDAKTGDLGDLHVGEVHLIRSDLSPQGAKYTRLFTVSLEETSEEP